MRDMRDTDTDAQPENTMSVALCASKHPIERADGICVTDAIFPEVKDEDGNLVHYCVKHSLDFDAHDEHTDAWINENVGFLIETSNKLYIYVTGLTPVLTAFLYYYDVHMPHSCMVSLMHYDYDSDSYVEQRWI